MLTAEEAFQKSIEALENVSTIDALLVVEARIKEVIEKGGFAAWSDPLPLNVAEKLAVELEEFGYSANTTHTQVVDSETKQTLYAVLINWRFKPSNSRVNQPSNCG